MIILSLFLFIVETLSELDPALRITGGNEVRLGTVKSFVALEVRFESSTKLCGGFLGSPGNRVYTAASCVFE